MSLWEKLSRHHLVMMVLFCLIPLGVALIAGYFWGFSKSYWGWIFLLLCPLIHYFMMKEFHTKKATADGHQAGSQHGAVGGKGRCH